MKKFNIYFIIIWMIYPFICTIPLSISQRELANTPVASNTEFYNFYLIKTAILEPFEVSL